MHTSNQGFMHTFELVQCIFVYVPYHKCSLPIISLPASPFPSFPFPLFPSLIPCQKQSVALVTHPSPLHSKSVQSLPSSSPPTVPCPLSLFSIMFPALFPYFRLCSCPLSLFSIMFLIISVPDVLMLLIQIVGSAIYVLSG